MHLLMELLLQRIILKNYNIGFLLIKGSGPYFFFIKQKNLMMDSLHQCSGLFPGVLSSLPKKEGKWL